MHQGDDETRSRVEAEVRQAMQGNAADDRSFRQKQKDFISAPFEWIKIALMYLTVIGAIILIGGAVWFLVLRGDGSHGSHQKVLSQKTIPAKPNGGSPTPPATDQPPADSSDTPQPIDGTPTADQWNVGTQIMNLKLAVTACLGQKMLLRKSTVFAADYCSDPSNLPSGGYSFGGGPDQVQASLSVTQTTVDAPHKLTFHDETGHTTTKIVHGTDTYNDISGSYSGETADGEILSVDPSGEFIINDQNQAPFWIISFSEPPCPTLAEGQSCLAQPTQISDSGFVEDHGTKVVKSNTFVAD